MDTKELIKNLQAEFDNNQRRFLGGLIHSTKFNQWFNEALCRVIDQEIKRERKLLDKIIKKKEQITNDPFHPVRCQYLGQQEAKQDTIAHLTSLKELIK